MAATPALQPIISAASTTRFEKAEMIIVSLLCLVGPIGAGIYLAPLLGWLTIAMLMFVYVLYRGRWISGQPLGALINDRNPMSRSRFQMASWTVLLLSAFLAIVLKLPDVLVAIVSLVAYAYAQYSTIGSIYVQEGFAMPVRSTAFLVLLGISNAAYLTNKTVQHNWSLFVVLQCGLTK